ncbi:MAG: hypothetical protein WC438_02070 [Candidatus Pacearchaeota archaeon]
MAYNLGAWNVTDILNTWAEAGVFAYIIPGLMIFALVYGILMNAKILGNNKGVNAIVALSVGLLSLQFDWVANFFATIFPYAGMGIAVLLVAMILMGFIVEDEKKAKWIFFGIGALIFLVVIIYSLSDFAWFGGYSGVDWAPWIVLILLVAAGVVAVVLGGDSKSK